MKYAFYPGCVARGATPELYTSTIAVCDKLGIELEIGAMEAASCTGSGVLQEKNQRLGDTLNARNFALAERAELPIMTICSTCQGVMSQAEMRLAEPEYRASVNEDLAEENLEYTGNPGPRHLLWILLEDYGMEKLKSQIVRPLTGLKIAPFYGCYLVRPEDALAFGENPQRKNSLEMVIEIVGAEVADFPGKTACCGFPILTINQTNSMKMVSNHTLAAKREGATAMVTPCPLCHLNLDGYQPTASRQVGRPIDLPILHLPQLLGLALGIEPEVLRLNKHIVETDKVLTAMALTP
jgi:succinate dehydrogenase / fumarate reductase cytochrome b subunit